MRVIRTIGLWTSGRGFRRLGLGVMCWSVATASLFGDAWVASFLLGAWIIGIGCGLG